MLFPVFIFISCYVLLYFCGYFIKVLLLDEKLKKFDLYITPWIGLSVVVIALTILSHMGWSVSSSAWPFFVIVTICNIVVFVKKRVIVVFEKTELLTLLGLGSIIYMIYIIPVVLSGFNSFTQWIMNNDFLAYTVITRYVLEESVNLGMIVEGMPSSWLAYYSVTTQTRNFVFFIAFFARIFNLEIADITYIITWFILFLNISIFRVFLKIRSLLMLGILSILCFNGLYRSLVYWSFIGQSTSIGIVVLLIFLMNYIAEKNKFDLKMSLLYVLLLTCLGFVYIEALAYPIIPIVIFSVAVFYNKKYDKKEFWKNIMSIGALYAVFNLQIILKFFTVFLRLDGTVAGWPMPISTLSTIAGYFEMPAQIFSINNNNYYYYLNLILTLGINFILIFVLVKQLENEGKKSFLSVVLYSYIGLYLVFIFMYAYLSDDTYKIYKAAVSLSFIVIIFVIRYLESIEDKKPKMRKIILMTFGIIYLLNLISTANMFIVKDAYAISLFTKEHFALHTFSNNDLSRDSDFIVHIPHQSEFITYSLLSEYLLPIGRTYNTSGRGIIYFDTTVKETVKENDYFITLTNAPDIYKMNATLALRNSVYSIYRFEEDSIYLSSMQGLSPWAIPVFGYIADEYIDVARNIEGYDIQFQFVTNKPQLSDFNMRIYNIGDPEPAKINAYVNDKLSEVFNSEDGNFHIILENIELAEGANTIRFVLEGENQDLFVTGLRFKEFTRRERLPVHVEYVRPLRRLLNREINEPIGFENIRSAVEASGSDASGRIKISVKNLSDIDFFSNGLAPIYLGINLYDKDMNVHIWDFGRIPLGRRLRPQAQRSFNYLIPFERLEPGEYYLSFRLVQETVAWFPTEDFESNRYLVRISVD